VTGFKEALRDLTPYPAGLLLGGLLALMVAASSHLQVARMVGIVLPAILLIPVFWYSALPLIMTRLHKAETSNVTPLTAVGEPDDTTSQQERDGQARERSG